MAIMRPTSVFGLIVCLLACAGCFQRATPESTAAEILENVWFRRAAIDRAISYGDEVITPLRERSRDFSELSGEAPFRLVLILSANPSSKARATLIALSKREAILPRLVGLAGCARRCDPGSDDDREYLRRIARGEFTPTEEDAARFSFAGKSSISENQLLTYRSLAIIALSGFSDAATAVTLESILMGRAEALYEDAASSLCTIGGPGAKTALWRVLRSSEAGSRPEALRMLVALGEKGAIGEAIGVLTAVATGPTNSHLARELATITGQQLGSDGEAWMRWWRASSGGFQVPSTVTCGGWLAAGP